MSVTHERDIPGLANQTPHASSETCHSSLAFCLPTSLSFFKRLTWEQTPWLHAPPVNPLTTADAHTILHYLSSHFNTPVPPASIQNALLFGSGYSLNPSQETLGAFPHLFIIFPHASGATSRNETFLRIFHDDIVKPAFDRAWKDSGLALIRGADVDGQTRIMPPSGTTTPQDALPAKRFLERFRNGNPVPVRAYWPVFQDVWGMGSEGRHTAIRAHIYHEAWKSIKGMLNDHPDLPSFQDPILLALCRGKVYVAPESPAQAQFRAVGQEWDKFVDARFVKRGSFRVVFETVLGDQKEGAALLGVDGERVGSWVEDVTGRKFKRMAEDEDESDEDAGAHQRKRVK